MRGTVYCHKRLQFEDGEIGKKLIILLNSPSHPEPYLFLKTTTQQKSKPKTPGCIPKHKVFFIPCNGDCFIEDTWVQLYHVYEFTTASMIKNGLTKDMNSIGKVNYETVNQIVNCLMKSCPEDILPHQKEMLAVRTIQ